MDARFRAQDARSYGMEKAAESFGRRGRKRFPAPVYAQQKAAGRAGGEIICKMMKFDIKLRVPLTRPSFLLLFLLRSLHILLLSASSW